MSVFKYYSILKMYFTIVDISNKLVHAQKECSMGLFPELLQNTKDVDHKVVQTSITASNSPFFCGLRSES